MDKRNSRVSEAQFHILLEFLQRNPNLARARGYNNSARGRAESLRLWTEISAVLNADGSGTYKSPKNWAIYVSNYKSRLKKIVAEINATASGTGGGPPQGSSLSEIDQRFLAILGPGFGQAAPQVRVHPFPDADSQQPSLQVAGPQIQNVEDVQFEVVAELEVPGDGADSVEQQAEEVPASGSASAPHQQDLDTHERGSPSIETENQAGPSAPQRGVQAPDAEVPPLPRRTRQTRYRSRPLAPLDEARRILSQVELQRAEADAANARALDLIGRNLGRLADAAERYLNNSSSSQ